MLTISKPLSSAQVASYHVKEYAAASEKNYHQAGAALAGRWQGRLAETMGLTGDVETTQFQRLAHSKDPRYPDQDLLRVTKSTTYVNERGELVTSMARRAAWDATISAPKSVSLVALVGGDEQVMEAHRESVKIALEELERYTDARLGGARLPERTGQFIAATFEHDTARPVAGYSAPQLHTHAVIFNVTETSLGKWRAIQSRELMKSQALITKVYRAELAVRLKGFGYELERDRNGALQIRGFSPEYLSASSPRRAQILKELEELGFAGAAAAQIAAQRTKDAKRDQSPEEIRQQHQELAATHGHQAARVVAEARTRARSQGPALVQDMVAGAKDAVAFARAKGSERAAVVDERTLETFALDRGMGHTSLDPIRQEFARRIEAGDFLERAASKGTTGGRAFTTPEAVNIEQDMIARMRAGQNQYRPLGGMLATVNVAVHHRQLNADQRDAVNHLLASRDQIVGLNGVAGSGKTYALSAVREIATQQGYKVQGLAPTSTASANLAGAGMPTQTLQRQIRRKVEPNEQAILYVLDEASLASNELMHKFIITLRPQDRLVMVGDTRQHQAVEAGKPYEMLQNWGMRTATMTTIVRQTDPQYRAAVEHLAAGEVRQGLKLLDEMGQMHGIPNRSERVAFVTAQFMLDPHNTLVVAPENKSRNELNAAIHQALQATRAVQPDYQPTPIFVDRKEMTGTDRAYADRYSVGDTLRYSKGSKTLSLKAGEYVTVTATDRDLNRLTVQKRDGTAVTYDPARLRGVSVYEPQERSFAPGDRVQFTAKSSTLDVNNRALGTLQGLDAGRAAVALDDGRTVTFHVSDHPHLDFGYALTSYVAQGETVDRVVCYLDNSRAHENITNQRLAYVACSRGRHEAIVITDDKSRAYANLERDVSERVAILPEKPEHRMERHAR